MECLSCGYNSTARNSIEVSFEGIAEENKPCWRIKWGTLDTMWWGPETALQACYMMASRAKEWSPDIREKWAFLRQVKLQYPD